MEDSNKFFLNLFKYIHPHNSEIPFISSSKYSDPTVKRHHPPLDIKHRYEEDSCWLSRWIWAVRVLTRQIFAFSTAPIWVPRGSESYQGRWLEPVVGLRFLLNFFEIKFERKNFHHQKNEINKKKSFLILEFSYYINDIAIKFIHNQSAFIAYYFICIYFFSDFVSFEGTFGIMQMLTFRLWIR